MCAYCGDPNQAIAFLSLTKILLQAVGAPGADRTLFCTGARARARASTDGLY